MAEESKTNEDILNELKGIKDILKSKRETLKQKFIGSVVSGFGAVVVATILVSLFLVILRLFTSVEILKPTVTRIIDIVDQTKKK